MEKQSVLVIGAGVGGIAAAAHLAQRGLRVTVLEKNARPGGRCDHFIREGHHFDTGPTLLVMRPLFEAEFAALGVPLTEALDLRRVDPTYHLVFDDGSGLALTSDMNAMRQQLEAIEPGSYHGFLRYMEEGHRHYTIATSRLVDNDFRRATDFFNLRNVPLIQQVKPLVPHYAHMANFFNSGRLKSAFTFQDVYMGLSPFEAPATFSMMSYTELAHGVWYPAGGMYSIVEALVEIAERAGVEFVYNTAVEEIVIDGHGTRGVVLEGGRTVRADAVLANADLPYVYRELLPPNGRQSRMDDKRYSCSTISFFWGVDKTYEALPAHTLFLADDYRANFDSIIDDLDLPDNPSLYIHAPARLDPVMAPPGQDTITAIVPVGHLGTGTAQDWRAIRDRAREQVFRRLGMLGVTDLDQHIKFETSFTPLSWRKRYNLVKGSTHGLAHNLTQLAWFRPANRHPRYHNLYFAGASTRPGTGLPTALVSARLAANRVLEDMSVSEAARKNGRVPVR